MVFRPELLNEYTCGSGSGNGGNYGGVTGGGGKGPYALILYVSQLRKEKQIRDEIYGTLFWEVVLEKLELNDSAFEEVIPQELHNQWMKVAILKMILEDNPQRSLIFYPSSERDSPVGNPNDVQAAYIKP